MERARILEVTSYPPPRAGWGIRVEFLKKRLEQEGHTCVVLNTGTSRMIPSPEYETCMGGRDFVGKVWRFARQGHLVHAHGNGDSIKGLVLALLAMVLAIAAGRRPVLTFHAGAIQRYFPLRRAPLMAPLFWLAFTLPRVVICNNEPVRTRIAGYGIPSSKIVAIGAFSREYMEFTVTPLPPDLEAFFQRYSTVLFSYLRMRLLFYPATLIEAMAHLAKRSPGTGLVICGGLSHGEPEIWAEVQRLVAHHDLSDRICFVEDLDHDAFLTTLQRSAIYVRTPITDGVASSVLESLALGIPVVASENGTRPPGTLTYPATDAVALADLVTDVLQRRDEVAASIKLTELPETVSDEIRILTS